MLRGIGGPLYRGLPCPSFAINTAFSWLNPCATGQGSAAKACTRGVHGSHYEPMVRTKKATLEGAGL